MVALGFQHGGLDDAGVTKRFSHKKEDNMVDSQGPQIMDQWLKNDKFFSEAFKENNRRNSNIGSRMSRYVDDEQLLAAFLGEGSGKWNRAKRNTNISDLFEQLNDYKKRLKDELWCRSCSQLLVPHQVMQCPHSHFFCLTCAEQVNACRVCNINGEGLRRGLRDASNVPIVNLAAEFENICPCCFARFYDWDDRHFQDRPKCRELMLERTEASEQSYN